MNLGYVLIHRKIREKGFYKKSSYVHLWLELCLCANHKEAEFMWNGETKTIKRGQFLTGRKELSEQTGIPQSTIEDILNFFEKNGKIRQQKTTKHRLISILKYDTYQKSDNRATTEQQQSDTNNNNKNENNENTLPDKSGLSSKKVNDMKTYDENKSFEEDAIDLESGELVIKEKKKKEQKPNVVMELISWAEEQRKVKFTNYGKQMKYVAMMLHDGEKTQDEIADRWEEMAKDAFWIKTGFDFKNVADSFDKK